MTRRTATLVAPPPERLGQLLLDRLLDEAADALPQARLDRVEPGRPGEQRRRIIRRSSVVVLSSSMA
jgi:hypothetical protein